MPSTLHSVLETVLQSTHLLNVGGYSGTAGDGLVDGHNLNGVKFSTKDNDNDNWNGSSCATYYKEAGGLITVFNPTSMHLTIMKQLIFYYTIF